MATLPYYDLSSSHASGSTTVLGLDPSAAGAVPTAAYGSIVSPGGQNIQMLNVNNILNSKDSRWLQLEVCREYQRNKCIRSDTECKFAHPPVTVEVQNGRVTACYDSIKVRKTYYY